MNHNAHYNTLCSVHHYGVAVAVSLFVLFTLLLSAWAMRLAFAEVQDERGRHELSRWQQQGYVDTGEVDALARTEAMVKFAVALQPDSARYWHTLSQIHEWRAYQSRFDRANATTAYYQALLAASRALGAQPMNATLWAAVSRYAFYSRGANPLTDVALANAAQLGTWQLAVQRDLVLFGIRNWRYLSPAARAHVRNVTRAAMRSDTTHQAQPIDHMVIEVAFANGWLDELLPLTSRDVQRERIDALLGS